MNNIRVVDLFDGTRTDAVKRRISTIRQGVVSFVESENVDNALALIAEVRKNWNKILKEFLDYEAWEKSPKYDSIDYKNWQWTIGRLGKIISSAEWARLYAIPDAERYLVSLDETEKAIMWLVKRWETK